MTTGVLADMHPSDRFGDGRPGGESGDIRAALAERERTIARLEEIVERNLVMLDRYDAVVGRMAGQGAVEAGDTLRYGPALERALGLLERAIERSETMARQNRSLELELERVLSLLERSLSSQEVLAGRGGSSGAGAAHDRLETTIAKYDGMLERSLAALEEAYRASRSSRKEIDERDRLLSRTLDALENAVGEGEGAGRRPGLFGRLFG